MHPLAYVYGFKSQRLASRVTNLLLRMADMPPRECFRIERQVYGAIGGETDRKAVRAYFELRFDSKAWDAAFLRRFRRTVPNSPATDEHVLAHHPRFSLHDLSLMARAMVKALESK